MFCCFGGIVFTTSVIQKKDDSSCGTRHSLMVTRERLPCSTLSFHMSDAQFKELRDILLPLARGFADSDNHVKILSEAVGMVTSRITSVEQTFNALSAKMALFAAMERNVNTLTENVNSLTARICKIETNAMLVSSGSDSARAWNIFGHSHGSTATGSWVLGPRVV